MFLGNLFQYFGRVCTILGVRKIKLFWLYCSQTLKLGLCWRAKKQQSPLTFLTLVPVVWCLKAQAQNHFKLLSKPDNR